MELSLSCLRAHSGGSARTMMSDIKRQIASSRFRSSHSPCLAYLAPARRFASFVRRPVDTARSLALVCGWSLQRVEAARQKLTVYSLIRNARSRPVMLQERRSSGRRERSHLCPGAVIRRVHSITSSASESMLEEISMPSALAVLRLITSSNLVGSITGRSAGLSPLRTRPTYTPTCRYKSVMLAP